MTVRTRPELETAANQIRDEVVASANTATRVGGFLRDAVDSMPLATEVPAAGAPANAEYVVSTLSGGLSAERALTNTTTIAWDFATAGQAKANVPDGGLPLAKFTDITAGFLGRASGTGAPTLLTGTQATALLDLFSTTAKGLAPASPGGTTAFMRADGTWATPPGTGAPVGAQYLVGATDGTLTAERLVTDTATIAWDLATSGQAKANVPNNSIDNVKAADMAEATIKLRPAGAGVGDPVDGTAAQARTILNMVLSQVLAGGNTTGANNLAISAAQVLELIAGTPSTAGPANALIEFKREGGGTSSFIGIRTSGGLRYEGQDGVTILGIASSANVSIASGSAASVFVQCGSGGMVINSASTGPVTLQHARCVQYRTLFDHGNSGTAKTIEWNFGTNNMPSALQKVTLTGNCAFTFSNPEMPAYPLMLELHQDATGGRDCTFPSSVKDAAALSAALLQTASTFAQVVFLWNGSFYTWQIVANGLTP